MVFVKHNSLKSEIHFNPIFVPYFLGSKFLRVQVFEAPGPGFRSSPLQEARIFSDSY